MKKITFDYICIIFYIIGATYIGLSYIITDREQLDKFYGIIIGLFVCFLFYKIESLEKELKKCQDNKTI